MLTSLTAITDCNGRPTDVIGPSGSRHALVLAAGIPKTLAVPESAGVMLVNATTDVWVQYGGPAAVPAADVVDGSAPELNPTARSVAGLASVGFATAADGIVSVSFFREGAP